MDNCDFRSCSSACCHDAVNVDSSGHERSQPQNQLWKPWSSEALSMAKIALELTQQEWSQTGLGETRLKASLETRTTSTGERVGRNETNHRGGDNDIEKNDDENTLKTIIDRIVALLLIRIVALVACRLGNGRRNGVGNDYNNICVDKNSSCRRRSQEKIYSDYSTTTICKTALQSSLDGLELGECCVKESEQSISCNKKSLSIRHNRPNNNVNTFPSQITPTVIDQLQQYVTVICRQYPPTKDVPYHNVEHAYHVFISANKLLDLLLCEEEHSNTTSVAKTTAAMATTVTSTETWPPPPTLNSTDYSPRHRPTFGLKSDPLSQLAYLFSALVHDVDHKGISNRQLVLEQNDLAILYNDQSVAEQRSLAVAFTTLKREEYDMMREVLFLSRDRLDVVTPPPTPPIANVRDRRSGTTRVGSKLLTPRGVGALSSGNNEDFLNFRKLVIDLVLVTDIASPERTQIVKSKWKEAFGDVVVAEKLRKRESATSAATTAATAANATSRSSEITKSSNLVSTCRSGADDKCLATAPPPGDMPQKMTFSLDDSMSSSTSSPSLSTIQSTEEDDFDASMVSRSKMNFNNDEIPSPSRSYDSMENLLEAAANFNLDCSDATLRDKKGGNITRKDNSRDGGGSKLAKRSSYQHQEESDDNLDLDRASGESLRWSTGDLSRGDNHHHHCQRESPSPMRLSQSCKTPHGMRYMPRRLHKLGVRRALDLAGSTITAYNTSPFELSEMNPHQKSVNMRDQDDDFDPNDDVDEFKATVVLEQMMHAADVAALFQDWENVVEWSTRLYKELNNSYLSNRGDDPSLEWNENQMKFFDFYILPLAKNLAVMGVFDEDTGERFVHGVKSNMVRWIRAGGRASQKMKEDEEKRLRGNPLFE